jgi:hypothetical protein
LAALFGLALLLNFLPVPRFGFAEVSVLNRIGLPEMSPVGAAELPRLQAALDVQTTTSTVPATSTVSTPLSGQTVTEDRVTGSAAKVSFTPILAPMPRGILATITMKLNAAITNEAAHKIYQDAYKGEEFVKVLPIGQMPQTSSVLGSNYVALQVAVDSHTNRLVVSVAIDNLVKGAAGQAIQNANIICGFAENLGLTGSGLGI